MINMTENIELFTRPVRHVAKRTTPQGDVVLVPMQRTDRLSATIDRQDRAKSNKTIPKRTPTKVSDMQPNHSTINAISSLRSYD